jgi:hypothetical protein
VGQIAIHLVPIWSVEAGMQSNLDPNKLPMQQAGPIQPVLPGILTPFGWLDTFLTPNADTIFSDFIVLEAGTTTKTVVLGTPTPAKSATSSVTTLLPTAAGSPTVTITQTKQSNATVTSPAVTILSPTATRPPPTAVPPTAVPPTAVPPTTIPPPPTATLSTPPVLFSVNTPPPNNLGVDTPPDGIPGNIAPGTYTIVNISSNPVRVSNTPDGNYDMIFYEVTFPQGSGIRIEMDQIIIGVSNNTDGSYYQVFNWGDNVRDANTNIDTNTLSADPTCVALTGAPECDNRDIQITELYPSPGTGILIDVDTAPGGRPPEGSYNYLVIISPVSVDAAQVDTIVVTEVPIPPPIPTP